MSIQSKSRRGGGCILVYCAVALLLAVLAGVQMIPTTSPNSSLFLLRCRQAG